MPECDDCGNAVSASYARVFGANDGTVYGCRNCCLVEDIVHGRAADLDRSANLGFTSALGAGSPTGGVAADSIDGGGRSRNA